MSDFESFPARLTRRAFIGSSAMAAAAIGLAGCATTDVAPVGAPSGAPAAADTVTSELAFGDAKAMYAATVDDGHALPAIPVERLDPKFLRQVVDDPTGEKPGTIVVDASQHVLYLVRDGGKAIRYGVSLGKAGFGWTGDAVVQWKTKWPVWTPPAEMIARRPELEKYRDGMPPGPQNPLGARALYLFRDGVDTMYRLHGTPEWDSIGRNASSGCVRFINQDIINLFGRVTGPAPVSVRANLSPAARFSPTSTRRAEPIDAGVPGGAQRLG